MPFPKKSAPVDLSDDDIKSPEKHTQDEFLDLAESIIFKKLQKGDAKLALDVLKLRGAGRGWKSGSDMSAPPDTTIQMDFRPADPSKPRFKDPTPTNTVSKPELFAPGAADLGEVGF